MVDVEIDMTPVCRRLCGVCGFALAAVLMLTAACAGVARAAEPGTGLAQQLRPVTSAAEPYGYAPPPFVRPAGTVAGQKTLRLALDRQETLPASYSLVPLSRVSAIRNQNPYGTCWSFAATASLESALMPDETMDFSEDNMVLASGFEFDDPYNNGGNDCMASAYLTRWAGPVDESSDAYGDGDTPPGLAAVRHVQEIRWIPAVYGTDTAALKRAVTDTGAVSVSVYWSGSYYRSANKAFYVPPGAASSTNHAVAVVGWDDAYPAASFVTAPPGDGAWLVRNSWGTGWGAQGYFWVSYYDAFIGDDPWAYCGVEATGTYDTIYQHDTLGLVNSYGFGSQSAWFANHFAATADEQLAAVAFWALTPGTSYEVWVGAELQQPDLAEMTLLATGTFTYAGYQTVAFAGGPDLTAGEHFVVAVKVGSPGTLYPIPIEMRWSGYSDPASGAPGESYISSTGTSWADFDTRGLEGNVCLKAFTGDDPPPDEDPPDEEPPADDPPADDDPPSEDLTAPLTTDDADTRWYNRDVLVTLVADDGIGSGVEATDYRVDGGAWIAADEPGYAEVLVAAAGDHTADGVHTIAYRSTDAAGNLEAVKDCPVRIDTRRPATQVLSAAAVSRLATIRYRVADAAPSCGSARVTIVVSRRNGTVVRRVQLRGPVRTNQVHTVKLARKLASGTYVVRILARDAAGNVQSKAAGRSLVVR